MNKIIYAIVTYICFNPIFLNADETYRLIIDNRQPIKEYYNRQYGKILSDLESHLKNGNPYVESDLVGYAHEGSHGANGLLSENEFYGRYRSFYALNNQSVRIKSPDTTVLKISKEIPQELRGDVYNTYFVQNVASRNDRPLFLIGELVAYTHGSLVLKELSISGRDESIRYMVEFCMYSMCFLKSVEYDTQLFEFVKFYTTRAMSLYNSQPNDRSEEYLSNIRYPKTQKSYDLGIFMKKTFGPDWVMKNFSF